MNNNNGEISYSELQLILTLRGMILKIHKALSSLTEGHSQVSFSRWVSMWPSGTGATNILAIRLYESLQDPYINSVDTRMLYKAAQVCDVEGYKKNSLNRT